MSWIESHQELANHPKTKKMARKLGETIPSTIGRLHFLWWWAMDYAQTGDLSKFEPSDIADAVMWDGNPNEVLTALIESGFIDACEDGTLAIHDWNDYAGRLIDKRKQNTERKRLSRERHADVTRTSHKTDVSVTGLPYLTVPNRTKKDVIIDARATRTEDEQVPTPSLSTSETEDVKVPALASLEQLPALPRDEIDAIESSVLSLVQRSMLYPDEIQMLREYLDSSIPLTTIVQGIKLAFSEYKPKTKSDKINRITYCASWIEQLHDRNTCRSSAEGVKKDAIHANGRNHTRGVSQDRAAQEPKPKRPRVVIPDDWQPPAARV